MHFQNILVTTDFSDDSKRVFDLAAYESKMEGSRITVLSVVSDWEIPPLLIDYLPSPSQRESFQADLKKTAESRLATLVSEGFHGLKVETKIIMSSAPVHQEIVDFAKNDKSDLIVIASHGRGVLGSIFLGSTVHRVLKMAPCPVLVVPRKN